MLIFLFVLIPWGGKEIFALDPDKAITQYIHNAWTTNHGLPQNSILAISQTPDGYLWFGTEEGLVRFNGKTFHVFSRANTEEMKHSCVMELLVDKKGSLWIGTLGGGLNRYEDGKFTVFTTEDGLSADSVGAIFEGQDGSLWIGTLGGGLNRYKDGIFTTYTTKEGLSSNFVSSICEGKEGSLWIGTYQGLNRYKDGKFTAYTTKEGLSNNIVRAILEDRKGNLWLGTDKGLDLYKDGKFIVYTAKEGLPSNIIRSMFEDRQGNLWIGTTGGIGRLQGGKFTTYTTKEGLANNVVLSIYEDMENSLWIGIDGGGLNRFKDGKFTTYTTKEGLSNDIVRPICEGGKGNIWIGTDNGLNKLKDGKFEVLTTKEGLSNNVVRALAEDKRGNLWIGTYKGLSLYKDGKFTGFTTRDGLHNDNVKSIYEDNNGNIWIGTTGGLNRFRNGKFASYTTREGLSNNIVTSMREDDKGDLWIGTYKGLNKYRDGKITTYSTKDGLSSDFVTSIYKDDRGNLWIGTYGGGLNKFNDGRFTTYTKKKGFFDDNVFQILEDRSGNLWMSCNNGIFCVNKNELDDFGENKTSSLSFTSYGEADGMRSKECNGAIQPAGWRSRDGKLWFPTVKGVVVIDPENIKINDKPPPVVIEKVIIDDKSIYVGEKARLSPGKRKFEFHYAGLSFLVPEKVLFKFKLEGFDDKWVDAGTRRTAYYTNIPPGSYSFKVIACNNDGVWNETGASFDFYLKPLFYQTWWFYFICTLGTVFLGAVIFQVRVKQLKKRKEELEQLVTERTKQLNKAYKKLEQLATHDSLTGIANRRSFMSFFDSEWRRCIRQLKSISIIMIDVDDFKAYNDTYGHQAGDKCLRAIAQALKTTVNRPGDLVARYGGEEFLIILSETESSGAAHVAERGRVRVESLNMVHENSRAADHVTISIGCAATVPKKDDDSSILIKAADEALYKSKEDGRNRVTIANI